MTPERLKWYQAMIADEVRERAFRKALEQRARGRTIVDVGSGFGHLSLYALQAGAEHCYLIERDKEAVERSRLLLDSNGFADEYTIVHGDCRRVDLSRVGDVVVSETLDVCGAGEGTIEILNNASRFLKPGGVIMPAGLELHVALLYVDTGLPVGKLACMDIDGELTWFDWVPGAYKPVFAQRTGTVHALVFAFTAKLVPGVHLTNLPGFPRTHWRQGVLPLDPFLAKEGDRFMIKAEITSPPESESEQCNINYELAKIQGG